MSDRHWHALAIAFAAVGLVGCPQAPMMMMYQDVQTSDISPDGASDASDIGPRESGTDAMQSDGDASPSPDVTTGGDGASDGDAVGADSGGDGSIIDDTDDDPPTDVPMDVSDPCAVGSVVDLNTAGDASASGVDYMGTNTLAPAVGSLTAACYPDVGWEVVLAYTMMGNGHLAVSTANPGTPSDFDSVLWVQDACSPTGASLGCNGDATLTDHRSTLSTSTAESAGTTVYIVVAGSTVLESGFVSQSTFELSVAEIPDVLPGGACDPMGAMNVCAAGSQCLPSGDAGSTCVTTGALGGRCVGTTPHCNSGLGCNGDPVSSSSRCVPAIGAGGACDPTGVMNVCGPGLSCNSGTCS